MVLMLENPYCDQMKYIFNIIFILQKCLKMSIMDIGKETGP